MSNAAEYKRVPYKKFQSELHKCKININKDEMCLAMELGKSFTHIRNCFNDRSQIVSDEILSKLMKRVGMEGKIEWVDGVRYYCIENK